MLSMMDKMGVQKACLVAHSYGERAKREPRVAHHCTDHTRSMHVVFVDGVGCCICSMWAGCGIDTPTAAGSLSLLHQYL